MKLSDMTGAVICGGKSKRFGSDKRLFKYKGQTLLDTSYQKLNQICHETICVFRDPPPIQMESYPKIFDDSEVEGPMAGVLAALEYSSTPYIFVLPCDVPKISTDFLGCIASLRSPDKIVALYSNRLEPLIGVYPKIFYEKLKVFSGKKNPSLKAFLNSLIASKKDFVLLSDLGYKTACLGDFENFNGPKD